MLIFVTLAQMVYNCHGGKIPWLQMARDWLELAEHEGLLALAAQADPVLAELWNNEKDAAYGQL